MFGNRVTRDEHERLLARLDKLEQKVRRVDAATAQAAPLLQDTDRLARLATEAQRTVEAVQAAVSGAAATADRPTSARFRPRFNQVYQAKGYGYVAAYFTGGRTGTVRLLVGDENPPEYCISEANVANDINSFLGGIVRPGEHWMLQTKGAAGFTTCFTPMY
ncbi:hypothetical protein [Micromonospora coxensis]|uniref:Uncharacterized protein n=1 Tax=Micromonospora coxensis TaxID=356852 RepID=A0A1C5H0F3_9ACTN|nr:hypothetical protein [Micromonospora coxensis]SCG39490.1 hypothetical protein GA0070614_0640 [Micromonospora coxensis]